MDKLQREKWDAVERTRQEAVPVETARDALEACIALLEFLDVDPSRIEKIVVTESSDVELIQPTEAEPVTAVYRLHESVLRDPSILTREKSAR